MITKCKKCGQVFSAFAADGDEDNLLCNDCFVRKNKLTESEIAELNEKVDLEPMD